MSKRVVLFVDDSPDLLAGLRARLHAMRRLWDLKFAASGAEALEILASEPVDVIVSDLRMPEMDGAELLRQVKELYPRTLRMVLSGHADSATALRAVPVAQQFLAKPCEPGLIENVVNRACDLDALLHDDVVRHLVGRIDRLPPVPRVYAQLVAALTNENVTAGEVAEIVRQDMVICAKLLQMVNSAFFRLPRRISRIEEAVSYLGFTTVKQLVFAAEVFELPPYEQRPALSIDELQRHSLTVGHLAASLTTDPKRSEDAFVAGLLHDLGKLVLAVELPEYVWDVQDEMAVDGCPMHVAEQRLFGSTHAEIGGYLLGLWGLPVAIVEAVACHHVPSRVPEGDVEVLAAVHVANALVHELAGEAEPADEAADAPAQCWDRLDPEFIDRHNLGSALDTWRRVAAEQLAAEAMTA